MSKNIVIQEGGVGRQFTADKLKTSLVGGGACLWVPEDEVGLGKKSITKNGTYVSVDDGLYGYSQVTVNVAGGAGSGYSAGGNTYGKPGGAGSAITGKDKDGNEVVATQDKNTGQIVTTVIPSAIKVVTPPNNPYGVYPDGSTIDFTGIVVKAYDANGNEVKYKDAIGQESAVIPFSELVFPVTQADIGQADAEAYSDGAGVNAMRLNYTELSHWGGAYMCPTQLGVDDKGRAMFAATGNDPSTEHLATRYKGKNYAMCVRGSTVFNMARLYDYGYSTDGTSTARAGDGVFAQVVWEEYFTRLPESTADPTKAGKMAFDEGRQSVPVRWTRPEDGTVLETSFEIKVAPADESVDGASDQ